LRGLGYADTFGVEAANCRPNEEGSMPNALARNEAQEM
jgi:hypothetical protein